MFDVYTKLFDYLDARNVVIRQQLGTGADQFAVLLRKQPKARGPALGRQFETYLKELIRYGLKNSATETYFLEFLKGAGILRTSPRGGTRIVLRPRPSTVKLSAKDITDIKKALATAEDMASKLQAPPQKPLPRSPGLLDQIIGEDPRSASVTHGSGRWRRRR